MGAPWKHWFGVAGCVVLSAVLSLPFTPWARSGSRPFNFEVTVSSSVSGVVQLFFDTGSGYREGDSSLAAVPGGYVKRRLRFPLPEGTYPELRFDPLNKSGVIRVEDAVITDSTGRRIRPIPFTAFRAANQIHRLELRQGAGEIVTDPNSGDPSALISFTPPLRLQADNRAAWRLAGKRGGLIFLSCLAFYGAAVGIAGAHAQQQPGPPLLLLRWRRTPRRVIAAGSLLAALFSCYPVVFFGKSFLSPNNAVYLLYETFPTLPDYDDLNLEDSRGTDIGAVMWSHWPQSTVLHRALLVDHEWPLWNRFNSAGVPLLGQGITTFGDPLQLPALLSDGAAWAWDFHYVAARWLFAFGLGLAVVGFTRSLGAALLVAVSAPFIGFFAFRLNHPGVFSLCYAPWIVVCWQGIIAARNRPQGVTWCGGLMLVHLALLNCGALKEAVVQMAILDACGFALCLAQPAVAARGEKIIAAVGSGFAFTLLAAPFWLPFWDTLGKSWTLYDMPRAWQILPRYAVGLFDDLFYWQPIDPHLRWNPSANFLLFLGVAWSLAEVKTLWRSVPFRLLGLAAAVCLAVVFGWMPESWIIRIPFIANIIHVDNTFSCAALVLLAILAGFGFERMAASAALPGWRVRFAVSFLWIAVPLVAFFLWARPRQANSFFPGYVLALALATLAVPWLVRIGRTTPHLRLACLPWAAAAFFLIHARHGQQLNGAFDREVVNPQLRVNLKAPSSAIDFVRHHLSEPARTIGLGLKLYSGYNQALLLESPFGIDPLRSRELAEIGQVLGLERITSHDSPSRFDRLAGDQRAYSFLNVRYLLANAYESPPAGAGWKVLGRFDLAVFENTECWPRAFYTDTLGLYESTADFATLLHRVDGRPLAAARRGDLGAAPPEILALTKNPLASRRAIPATDYVQTNNTITFQVEAPGPGVVALQETFYPRDFTVTLNAVPAEYFRLNHAFKGVYLPRPGHYRITFTFRPEHWQLAKVLAALGLGLTATGLAWTLGGSKSRVA